MAKALTIEALLDGPEGSDKITAQLESLSFEDGLKFLEELVQRVESGTLPLEKAVLCSERGAHLVQHLRKLLSGAEERLKLIPKEG